MMIGAIFAILVTSSVAFAGSGPKEFLVSVDKKLAPLLTNSNQNKNKIVKIVNKLIDFPTLCKASLGKHWDKRKESERKEFSDTLHALIEKNVVSRLKDTKDHKINYESESVSGGKATVVTVVIDGDGPRASKIEIVYKMKKKGGQWTVVDMVTDGVSLVSNYRSQFNKIIEKDGWSELIKKMKDKLAK